MNFLLFGKQPFDTIMRMYIDCWNSFNERKLASLYSFQDWDWEISALEWWFGVISCPLDNIPLDNIPFIFWKHSSVSSTCSTTGFWPDQSKEKELYHAIYWFGAKQQKQQHWGRNTSSGQELELLFLEYSSCQFEKSHNACLWEEWTTGEKHYWLQSILYVWCTAEGKKWIGICMS